MVDIAFSEAKGRSSTDVHTAMVDIAFSEATGRSFRVVQAS